MLRLIAASLASTALATGAVWAVTALDQSPGWTEQADAFLDTHFNEATPGVTVIVTRGGQTLYHRGAGMADLDAGISADADTVYRLGSITKQVSSAILLQMVEDGQVSLDDTVADYLPDYPEPGASATVRQLLNHTSGIQSYTSIPGWMTEANTSRAYSTPELIAEFADFPPQFQPGESWNYNNSGYVLVGAVIEAVAEQPWHIELDRRISDPLELDTLRTGQIAGQFSEMAAGYTLNQAGEIAPSQRIHMSVPHAAGELISNASDLAEWADALHGGQIVSDDLYAQMIAPTVLPDGTEIPYGYGLVPGDVRGRSMIGHGGGIFGFSTDSLYLPEDDIFVAVLANSDAPAVSPSLLARRLASFAIGDPYPIFTEVDVDPASFEPLFGVYAIAGTDDTRQFFARNDQLYTQRSGGAPSQVFAAGDNRFFYGTSSLSWFQIVPADDGAHVMNMHQQGAHDAEPAIWSGPVPEGPEIIELPEEILSRYVGDYSLGAATLTVRFSGPTALEAQLTGQSAFELTAVSETEFLVQAVGARLVFDAGETAPALTLLQGGQEIRAERMAE